MGQRMNGVELRDNCHYEVHRNGVDAPPPRTEERVRVEEECEEV